MDLDPAWIPARDPRIVRIRFRSGQMTLDEFLRTLETLTERRVDDDDPDPGEGNFDCRNCRACYSCRFCVGCDDCEDCTYCEESLGCTSCTQSKRCITCEKSSYCEDCRDCKGSRYLTLCIECTDCVHCLACVGLEGAEFCVLNEKRSRKEYFAVLHQLQELLRARSDAGWRPAVIGLASDVIDGRVAGRDVELSAAPWLDELFGVVRAAASGHPDLDALAAELEVDDELALDDLDRALGHRAPGRPDPSPWLDEPKRGSLRRAERPSRPVDADPIERTGSGSYRSPTPPQREPTREPAKPGLLTGRRPTRQR